MTKQLEKRRDELAYKQALLADSERTEQFIRFNFKNGFNACYAEMVPLIQALWAIESCHKDTDAILLKDVAREALKKIGVE